MSRAVLDVGADVREGLSAQPKQLPPRLFYDAEGSALFEAITELPEYYLTRTETGVLEARADEILDCAGSPSTVVELGAGSARKTLILLRALVARQAGAVFVPVDVSPAALELARDSVRQAIPEIAVEPLEGRYRVALEALKARDGKKLVLFIGSSVGNFDPEHAVELLRDIRAGMSKGDALLLGTDLRKDPSILVPAYDDAAGVTARFNKNVLARINRELGGTFALEAFRHVAQWNDADSRMEMHLESLVDQEVSIAALGMRIQFACGERIHTESSYKFRVEQVSQLLAESGFHPVKSWLDERGWYGLHLGAT